MNHREKEGKRENERRGQLMFFSFWSRLRIKRVKWPTGFQDEEV